MLLNEPYFQVGQILNLELEREFEEISEVCPPAAFGSAVAGEGALVIAMVCMVSHEILTWCTSNESLLTGLYQTLRPRPHFYKALYIP